MANSIFVPLGRPPASLAEIKSWIANASSEFGLPAPDIKFDKKSDDSSVESDFIVVQGVEYAQHCWISISTISDELTGEVGLPVLVDVKTRLSWPYAAIVAYAFCRFGGRVVLNDALELNGEPTYSADSLKAYLVKEFTSQT